MRPDLSALDAQLDALSPAAGLDVLALAQTYAGTPSPLASIDEELSALETGVPVMRAAPVVVQVVEPEPPQEPVSEQIELPEPLAEALLDNDQTGQYALDEVDDEALEELPARALEFEADSGDGPVTARHDIEPLAGKNNFKTRESGAFTVPNAVTARRDDTRDITMEPIDAELLDAEINAMRPEAPPLANNSLFDLQAPIDEDAEREADEAFAELFAEATRESNMPSASENDPAEDTEVFHADELDLDGASMHANYPAARGDDDLKTESFHDETLDSAEFEIVNDVVTDARPSSSPSGRPSRPPEKRPSFLGRLFGRKEDQ